MARAPVLDARRLNRALLARQLLLRRASLPIPSALEHLGGIQNQYAPNAYLRLWSCLARFERGDLTRALEDGSVVQGTLMRGTIHLVSAADYGPMLAGLAPGQARWSDRLDKADGIDRAPWIQRVRAALAKGPMRRPELNALIADAPPSVRRSIDTDAGLLRIPPSGTWDRRRADLCALADVVIGPSEVSEADGMRHLVRRYLAAFGPASVRDVASFIGTTLAPVKEALAAMELRHFRDEEGRELIDMPDAPLPDRGAPAPVRFLPTWDAILLVHARRTHVLPEAFRPIIFSTKMPPSYPTVLVDGVVAGTWRWEDEEIQLRPLRPWTRAERAAVDDEAQRLTAFHAA